MNNLNITKIDFMPIENGFGGCVAIAQVVLGGIIKFTGIKLMDDAGHRYISYPRNLKNKKKRSYFYPVNAEFRTNFEKEIWNLYDNNQSL